VLTVVSTIYIVLTTYIVSPIWKRKEDNINQEMSSARLPCWLSCHVLGRVSPGDNGTILIMYNDGCHIAVMVKAIMEEVHNEGLFAWIGTVVVH